MLPLLMSASTLTELEFAKYESGMAISHPVVTVNAPDPVLTPVPAVLELFTATCTPPIVPPASAAEPM